MKYIMFQTTHGQKLPFIFPECMTHMIMALFLKESIMVSVSQEAMPVSAGFVNLGLGAEVHGESESMGEMKSVPGDAARIMVGASIEFMPDDLAEQMLVMMKQGPKP